MVRVLDRIASEHGHEASREAIQAKYVVKLTRNRIKVSSVGVDTVGRRKVEAHARDHTI